MGLLLAAGGCISEGFGAWAGVLLPPAPVRKEAPIMPLSRVGVSMRCVLLKYLTREVCLAVKLWSKVQMEKGENH